MNQNQRPALSLLFIVEIHTIRPDKVAPVGYQWRLS